MRYGDAQIDEARKLITCTEVLDDNRWVGVWRGQFYECRALPDTSQMSVGDAVFCHVLPGNSEIVAIFKQTGAMFIAPGYWHSASPPYVYDCALYKWDGISTPEKIWSFDHRASVTAMAQMSTNKRVYLAVYDYNNNTNSLY